MIETFDATVVLDWLEDKLRRAGGPAKVQVTERRSDSVRFYLFPQSHRYSVVARIAEGERLSYMGCIAVNTSWRPGEDWHRGHDLADGPLSRATLARIFEDIVAYELIGLSPSLSATPGMVLAPQA